MYGNAVKISTDSHAHSILSLCEVEVYADAYGKGQLSYFVKRSTKHANDQVVILRIPDGVRNVKK